VVFLAMGYLRSMRAETAGRLGYDVDSRRLLTLENFAPLPVILGVEVKFEELKDGSIMVQSSPSGGEDVEPGRR
jgi:hypothetical protein